MSSRFQRQATHCKITVKKWVSSAVSLMSHISNHEGTGSCFGIGEMLGNSCTVLSRYHSPVLQCGTVTLCAMTSVENLWILEMEAVLLIKTTYH